MGEGNAVGPYRTDPFSAQLPCGTQTQKRRLAYRICKKNALLEGELSDKRHLRVAFTY
jgi:hypothetical protein